MKWYLLQAIFTACLPVSFIGLQFASHTRTIKCTTQFGSCSPDLIATLSSHIGKPLFAPLNLTDPQVAHVTVQPSLPNTLHVFIFLRSPVGIVIDPAGKSALADQSGYLYAETLPTSSLPRLLVNHTIQIGDYLGTPATQALSLLNKTPATLNSFSYLDDTLLVFFINSITILVDTTTLSPITESSLQAVLARSKINSQVPKKIDLRYQNPIVVY